MANATKIMGLGIELESFCKSQSWGCWLRKRAWVGGNLWWIEGIGHSYVFWAIYAVGIGDKSFNKTDSPWIYRLIFFKRIYTPSRVEWIKNMWYICTYIYTYTLGSQHKRKWTFAICNNMDGFGGYYANWNKSHGEIQVLYDITYMWNTKNTTN